MTGDWIKIYRKILDSEVFANADLLKLWVLCLARANHKDTWVHIEGCTSPILVKRGQFVSGRYVLHDAYYPRPSSSDKSPLTVWRWLKALESMGNVNISANNKYSVVTVVNYELYQSRNSENEQAFEQQDEQQNTAIDPCKSSVSSATGPQDEQQMNSRRTTDEQQMNTNKNEKKDKNYSSSRPKLRFDEEDMAVAHWMFDRIRDLQPNRKKPNFQKWANTVRLMRQQDGRTHEDIRDLFKRANRDDFWQTNILSPEKLRGKWDDLDLKLRRQANGRRREGTVRRDSPARVRQRDYGA